MDVTQLVLTWVGWPNGEKLVSTCLQIWSRPKWTQVISNQRKCTQALAKRSRKLTQVSTQVFNLSQLASPFGQGLKLKIHHHYSLITFFSLFSFYLDPTVSPTNITGGTARYYILYKNRNLSFFISAQFFKGRLALTQGEIFIQVSFSFVQKHFLRSANCRRHE